MRDVNEIVSPVFSGLSALVVVDVSDEGDAIRVTERTRAGPVPCPACGGANVDDNSFSEANFKTIKYCGEYPESFNSLTHARQWSESFIAYYNHEHQHSGIGLHTPASVHFGTADLVREQRTTTLAEAYARAPERFAR